MTDKRRLRLRRVNAALYISGGPFGGWRRQGALWVLDSDPIGDTTTL